MGAQRGDLEPGVGDDQEASGRRRGLPHIEGLEEGNSTSGHHREASGTAPMPAGPRGGRRPGRKWASVPGKPEPLSALKPGPWRGRG